MTSSARMIVPRVSLTGSSDWPMTIQSSPTCWPARRSSTPSIVAVIGLETSW